MQRGGRKSRGGRGLGDPSSAHVRTDVKFLNTNIYIYIFISELILIILLLPSLSQLQTKCIKHSTRLTAGHSLESKEPGGKYRGSGTRWAQLYARGKGLGCSTVVSVQIQNPNLTSVVFMVGPGAGSEKPSSVSASRFPGGHRSLEIMAESSQSEKKQQGLV